MINRFTDGMKPFGDGSGHEYESEQTGDAEGNETVPVYECEPGCPVQMLDEQSGNRHSSGGGLQDGSRGGRGVGFSGVLNVGYRAPQYEDRGGASRFFNQFQAEPEAPFFYCPKVSKAERDHGLPKGFNKHPTAKPLKLMRHLVRLVTRNGGTVLDPFAGSGSTCIAALSEGCNFIGIERDPEFHELAVRRIAAAQAELRKDVWEDLDALGAEE